MEALVFPPQRPEFLILGIIKEQISGVSALHSVGRNLMVLQDSLPSDPPSALFWEPRNFQKFGNVASNTHSSPSSQPKPLDFPWWHNSPRHSQGASLPTHPFPRTLDLGPLFELPVNFQPFSVNTSSLPCQFHMPTKLLTPIHSQLSSSLLGRLTTIITLLKKAPGTHVGHACCRGLSMGVALL